MCRQDENVLESIRAPSIWKQNVGSWGGRVQDGWHFRGLVYSPAQRMIMSVQPLFELTELVQQFPSNAPDICPILGRLK